MSVEIAAVSVSEKSELWSMFQAYARELAPYAGMEPTNGTIPFEPFDDYWRAERHWPFWAMRSDEKIGFALVHFARDDTAMRMAEFYIVPAYRRRFHGSDFARALLLRFPGRWKIRQVAANTKAIAFWRGIAEPFGYTEDTFTLKGIDRVEQTLTVPF